MPRGVYICAPGKKRGRKPLEPAERAARLREAHHRASRKQRAKAREKRLALCRKKFAPVATPEVERAILTFGGLTAISRQTFRSPRFRTKDQHGRTRWEFWELPEDLEERLHREEVMARKAAARGAREQQTNQYTREKKGVPR